MNFSIYFISAVLGGGIAVISLLAMCCQGFPGIGFSFCYFPVLFIKALIEGPYVIVGAFDVGKTWSCGIDSMKEYAIFPALYMSKVLLKASGLYVLVRQLPYLVLGIIGAIESQSLLSLGLAAVSTCIMLHGLLEIHQQQSLLSLYTRRDSVNNTNPIDRCVFDESLYNDQEINLLQKFGRYPAKSLFSGGDGDEETGDISVAKYKFLVAYLSKTLFKKHSTMTVFSECYRMLYNNSNESLASSFEFSPEMINLDNSSISRFSDAYMMCVKSQLFFSSRLIPMNVYGMLFMNVAVLHCMVLKTKNVILFLIYLRSIGTLYIYITY